MSQKTSIEPELAERMEARNRVAISLGLPGIGERWANKYGLEFVVTGHAYFHDLTSMVRDGGVPVNEHPCDLLPTLGITNVSPLLADLIDEIGRCTNKQLVLSDTVPHLRPQYDHANGHRVDPWTDPDAICFFVDSACLHETILAHELGHIWIDLMLACEDHRHHPDLSDTTKIRQIIWIQSFVTDRKVNEVIRERGFDMSVIENDQWNAVYEIAQSVMLGYLPATKREAILGALTVAATICDQKENTTSQKGEPWKAVQLALARIRFGLPKYYDLAQGFADAIERHGYQSGPAIRSCIDECFQIAFDFTGETFDCEKDMVEQRPVEVLHDKWPHVLTGWPASAKMEVARLMAKNKIPVDSKSIVSHTKAGQTFMTFQRPDGSITETYTLQHAPPVRPKTAQSLMPPASHLEPPLRYPRPSKPTHSLPKISHSPGMVGLSDNPPIGTFTHSRGYMAGEGRWLSRARLKEQIELLEHPYTYVENNPVSLVDPTGLAPDYTTVPDRFKTNPESGNCATLAFRYGGGPMDPGSLMINLARGRKMPNCNVHCNPCEVKFWYWEYRWISYGYGNRSAGPTGSGRGAWHIVAGQVSCTDASDPTAVWSKDSRKPLQGPRRPLDFRPRSGIDYQDNPRGFFPSKPLTWSDIFITRETCYCLSLTAVSEATSVGQ